MEKSKRKSYRKHVFTDLADINNDLKTSQTIEGKRMFFALCPMIIKLQNNGIKKLQNIAKIFKDCGFNNKSTNQIIIFLLNQLEKKSLINSRVVNKLNDSYRNVILNSLFKDFHDKIIDLIDNFITNNCPDIHNHEFLIHQLKQIGHSNVEEKTISNIKNEKNDFPHFLSLLNSKFDDSYFFDLNVEFENYI